MSLYTVAFEPDSLDEQGEWQIGLEDLRKGLYRIVLGYVCCIGSVLSVAGLVWYVAFAVHQSRGSPKAIEEASTVFFAAGLLLVLAMLFSYSLIVRGKWLCLMHAPERYHAKWFMFASILCILAGPVLNIGSTFMGENRQAVRRQSKESAVVLVQGLDEYKRNLTKMDTRRYVDLAGDLASILSSVFFVLFLRALALCCGDVLRARFAECFLLFTGLLVAAVVVFLLNPARFLARPELLLGLAGGWLLAAIWYFVLILSAIGSLSDLLARR